MSAPQRSPREQVEAEVARLRDLDLAALRLHWRRLMRRPAPAQLPRHLLMKILAYRLQIKAFGDCDPATLRLLKTLGQTAGSGRDQPVAVPGQGGLRPGTVLVREWAGAQQRVMVLGDGFAWNGATYRSLSQVARAITGTRWSGPRFFGIAKAGEGRA
jgi:hypothetical protein